MKATQRIVTGAAGLLLLLAVLILLNAAASAARLRADLTGEKLYTLSSGTRSLLADLPKTVTLKFYQTASSAQIPPAYKQYTQRIGDLLREYEDRSGGKLVIEFIEPKPDSEEEDWAQRYGVAAQQLGEDGALYLGLVAIAGAKQAVIPVFSPSDEPQLEYLVTRLIAEAITDKKPVIGVLSSFPVMGTPQMYMQPGAGSDPWVFVSELASQYELKELPASATDIPPEIDTLLLIHPKRITDSRLYALDQFVLRGGKLIALVDPLCLADQEFERDMGMGMAMNRSDLNRLTSAWGLTMETDRVVADPAAATRVRRQDNRVERNLAWLTLRTDSLSREEIATSSLETLMLPMAGAFTGTLADGLILTPLLLTSAEAGTLTAMEATMGSMAGATSFLKRDQTAPIALRLTGRFKTAFPEGRPAETDATQPPGETSGAAPLNESTADGLVVLIGDADFIYDRYAVETMNVFGRKTYQIMNDNILFLANLVGQVAGDERLISLRSRGSFERPFTRVLALQKTAQERWREEELKIEEQIRLTQMKIDELQASKDPSQTYILSPEQKREIEQFREQLATSRAALKDVRKNLRRDIEVLGLKIKAINMAAMPLAVVVFGLAHGAWRRRRSTTV